LSFKTAFAAVLSSSARSSKQASKNINIVIVIAAFLSFFPRFSICFLCNPSLNNGEKRREEKRRRRRRRRRRKQQEKRNAHPSWLPPVVPLHPTTIS
jgi:hypothetical protein